MISRRTTTILAEAYSAYFADAYASPFEAEDFDSDAIYDFLFNEDYPAWFCNKVSGYTKPSWLKSYIQRLHTGEALADSHRSWNLAERQKRGQEILFSLAEDFLQIMTSNSNVGYYITSVNQAKLQSSLELDGYIFRDGRLFQSESDVLDTQEEQGILHHLYGLLALEDDATTMHHLRLSEEHYMACRWGDAISNVRMFLESVLKQIAIKVQNNGGGTISAANLNRPFEVRAYLENEGLLITRERTALHEVYGLLSNAGSHPNMSESDQARLLRNMALTLAQFVLLRAKGKLLPRSAAPPPPPANDDLDEFDPFADD